MKTSFAFPAAAPVGRGSACALALVLGLALGAGCHRTQPTEAPSAPDGEAWLTQQQATDAKLVIEPAIEHDVGISIVTSGRVTFDDLQVQHVFSPVTGRVTKIEAQLGQKMKKGDLLAIIDSPDLGMASADLGKAYADLVAAEHDIKRQRELFNEHAASAAAVETSEDNYRKTKAELERARQKARLLHAGSVDSVSQGYGLLALIDGEVIARNINPGIEVQGQYTGGATQELFTLGDVDRLWVLADVFEMDLPRIKQGEVVSVNVISYPKKTFTGAVDWVSGSLDPTTRTAKVRCTIPNPEHLLRPEMFATVSIAADGHKALALPRSAILHLGDQTVAFVEAGQGPAGQLRFERRPVTVDEEESGDFVPVTHGLEAGEKVVTSGTILLAGT
jgi:membrane fusion protein, heavy metal efflux system